MKIQIDLGTVDVEIQRSDGTWEKIQHARTRIRLDDSKLSLSSDLILDDSTLDEVEKLLRANGAKEVAEQFDKADQS